MNFEAINKRHVKAISADDLVGQQFSTKNRQLSRMCKE